MKNCGSSASDARMALYRHLGHCRAPGRLQIWGHSTASALHSIKHAREAETQPSEAQSSDVRVSVARACPVKVRALAGCSRALALCAGVCYPDPGRIPKLGLPYGFPIILTTGVVKS